jgi:hypothetical protein
MEPLPIDPHIIPQVFYWLVFITCLFLFFSYSGSNNCDKLLASGSMAPALILTIFLIIFVGLRPIHGIFGDTTTYARTYQVISPEFGVIDWGGEWLFALIRTACKKMGFTVSGFFLVVETGYLGFMFWAYKKALWENVWFAMLFAFSAYSLFTYGVNGMRNGLACSVITLAIIIAAKDRKYLIAGVLCFLAMGIHKSTVLPTAAMVAGLFFLKKPKMALWFWVISIPVSLVAGGPISNVLMGLGFDDRADAYMSGDNMQYGNFSHTGFRWDFLAYSAMPVWLIWYVVKRTEQKRLEMGVEKTAEEEESGVYGAGIMADAESMRVFNVIAIVYLLTNAFWVMVIKAAFSNRFAYLSWFIYPLVLAYGVIRLHIWEDQDKKAGLILLGHVAFTMFMYFQGKAF